MAPILQSNQTAFRACILYEVKLGRSAEEAYKNMCRATENDGIDFVDFQYWFYRFYHGNYDLDYDKRLDREPLSFSDLPNEILGEVVERLDLASCLRTRKVSRNLQSVVDNQKAHYDFIGIDTMPKQIGILFRQYEIDYMENDGKCVIDVLELAEMKSKKKVLNGDFLEIALNDLKIAMKKPRLQLEELILEFSDNSDFEKDKILNIIESLKYPIHVKTFGYSSILNAREEDFLSILSLFKSGTLEAIYVNDMNTELNVNQLVKMDHWKQAKRVSIRSVPIGLEHCLHFDSFFVTVEALSAQDMLRLLDVLSKSNHFNYCCLSFESNRPLNVKEIGTALGATVIQRNSRPMICHRHPIPGSYEFLEIEIAQCKITIERNT